MNIKNHIWHSVFLAGTCKVKEQATCLSLSFSLSLWFCEPTVLSSAAATEQLLASFDSLHYDVRTLITAYLPRNTAAFHAQGSDIVQFCCNTFWT